MEKKMSRFAGRLDESSGASRWGDDAGQREIDTLASAGRFLPRRIQYFCGALHFGLDVGAELIEFLADGRLSS